MNIRDLIERRKFILYVVTDDRFLPEDTSRTSLEQIRDLVKMCADGGASIFQYRSKRFDAYIQLKQAEAARQECEKNGILFAFNDRADLAHILEADILHVGQEDVPPPILKGKFPRLRIGFSTHNREQVEGAMAFEHLLEYISFGPVFGTTTKENPYPKTGIENLRWAVARSPVPVVAIGGINDKNLHELILTGVRAVAMISYVLENKKEVKQRCERIVREALSIIS